MSSGRGDGKNLPSDLYVTMADIDVNRLHEIDIGLHNRLVEMCRYYDLNCFRFDQYAKLHWDRTNAPTPDHLIRLKKPILPERWDGFRNGWSKEDSTVQNFLKKLVELQMMTDSQVDELMKNKPYPDAKFFFDMERMVVGWNGGWEKTEGIV